MTNLKNVVYNETSGHSSFLCFCLVGSNRRGCPPFVYQHFIYHQKRNETYLGKPREPTKNDKRRRISGHSGILFGVYGNRTYLEVQDQGRNSRLSGNETHDFGTHIGQGLGECPIQIPRCSEECGRGLPRLHFQRGTLKRNQQRIRISAIHVQSPSSGCAKTIFLPFKED